MFNAWVVNVPLKRRDTARDPSDLIFYGNFQVRPRLFPASNLDVVSFLCIHWRTPKPNPLSFENISALLASEKLTGFKEQHPQIGHINTPSWSMTPSSCSKNQLFQGVRRRGCGTSEVGMDMIFISCAGILSHPEKAKGPEAFSPPALRILFKPISNTAQPIQPISEAARFLPASAVGQKFVC